MSTKIYKKKPIPVACHQWFKNGDHPLDYSKPYSGLERGEMRDFTPEERREKGWGGDIVRRFRRPDVAGTKICSHCGQMMNGHGWIDTLEGGHIVCSGDWIITGIKGEHYPCKPDIFAATYEPALAPHPDLAGVEVVSGEVMGKVRAALDEGARSHRLYAMDYTEGSDPWRECIEMAERQEEALGLLGRGR